MNTIEPIIEGMATKYVSGAISDFFSNKRRRKTIKDPSASVKKRKLNDSDISIIDENALETIVAKKSASTEKFTPAKEKRKKLSASIGVDELVKTSPPESQTLKKGNDSKLQTPGKILASLNKQNKAKNSNLKKIKLSEKTHERNTVEDEDNAVKVTNNGATKTKKQVKKKKRRAAKTDGSNVNNRTIFVGNLPKNTSKEELAQMFVKYGKVITTRIRCVVPANPKIPRKVATAKKLYDKLSQSVNGYVVFATSESANEALNMNNENINGHHIRVDRANERVEYPPKRTVFIGNLHPETNEEDIRLHFEACGQIEAIRVVRKPHQAANIGIGFVCFKDQSGVALALKMAESSIKDRKIRVNRCQKQQDKSRKLPQKEFIERLKGKMAGHDIQNKNSSQSIAFSGKKKRKISCDNQKSLMN